MGIGGNLLIIISDSSILHTKVIVHVTNTCIIVYLQDLTAIGISKPGHRKKLKSEIARLNIHDGIPDFKPVSVTISVHLVTNIVDNWVRLSQWFISFPEIGPLLIY